MWDELRRKLGEEFAYGPASWFCVPHEDVSILGGGLFSQRFEGRGRPVVLAGGHGPNATLYARTTSGKTAFSHPAHVHDGELGTCALDKDGWIVYDKLVVVPATALCEDTFSCREPDAEWLLSELKKAGAL